MANGFGIELEEMGMVALIGVLLVPGMMWIANGKSTGGVARRTAVVAGLVAAALALEATLDRSANAVADEL